MTLVCKNICLNPEYKHKKVVRNILKTNYKKCSKCVIFIEYDGLYCPCCGIRLSKRRKKNNFENYNAL